MLRGAMAHCRQKCWSGAGMAIRVFGGAEMNKKVCDVVVVGAGAAGLSAARVLHRAGVDVLVLEAQDRVGGRTLSQTLSNGVTIDLGGQWVAPQQKRVLALAEEFGLRIFPTYDTGDRLTYLGGVATRVKNWSDGEDPTVAADLKRARERIDALGEDMSLETPWTHPDALRLDRMTFAEWVDQNLDTGAGRWRMKYLGPAVFSVDACELSMLHVAFYFAACGGVEIQSATEGGGQDSRFATGMQQISAGLANNLGDRVLMNQAVNRIEHGDNGVRVTTDELVVDARHAIVALSPSIAGRIRYIPAMPPARDMLTQRMPMGTALKMMLVYEKPFWRETGLSGFAVTDRDVPQLLYDNSPEDGSCGILLGFTEGFPARDWIQRSADERRAEAIATAIGCFGPEAGNVTDFVELSWMEQEFARGCYAGVMPPGVWTSFGSSLRDPVGAIHWAGSETATFWAGYVEGALQSGERAAAEVLAAREMGKSQSL